jgi:hypothetical protein
VKSPNCKPSARTPLLRVFRAINKTEILSDRGAHLLLPTSVSCRFFFTSRFKMGCPSLLLRRRRSALLLFLPRVTPPAVRGCEVMPSYFAAGPEVQESAGPGPTVPFPTRRGPTSPPALRGRYEQEAIARKAWLLNHGLVAIPGKSGPRRRSSITNRTGFCFSRPIFPRIKKRVT